MLTRIISGAAVAVIAILLLVFGGNILAAALFIISIIAYRELVSATGVRGNAGGKTGPKGAEVSQDKPGVTGLELVGFLGILLFYTALIMCGGRLSGAVFGLPLYLLILIVLVGVLMVTLAVYVLTFPRYDSGRVMAAYFSFIYGPFMLSFIYLTERLPLGKYAVWMIFISSWVCDTCAYFSGVAFGKHKMAPVLSPKKTIEGAIGGILGSAVLGGVFGYVLNSRVLAAGLAEGADAFSSMNTSGLHLTFAFICAVGAVISMIGDLAASAIKRNNDIKDYGSCIPGHGGIMDRFDSVIFTAPIIFILSSVLLGVSV